MGNPARVVGDEGRGTNTRSILVVEHEALVAHEIQSSLTQFGYDVPATAGSISEALEAVETYRPDLVLMDVGLEAGDDGIAAAAAIRARHPTPIVFLASHADDATLTRAQNEAQPHGYVLKPYQDGELRAAVEVALQRHTLEQEIAEQRALLAGVLSGMSDAVIAADEQGRVILVNEAGRRAFGDVAFEAGGAPNTGVYLGDQTTPCPVDELPLRRALRGETVRDIELFVRPDESTDGRWYDVHASPLLTPEGGVCGAVAVGRDMTEFRAARAELEQLAQTDPLTGLYNRGGFMQVARSALESAQQSGRRPAVFFIDLNGMKRINDSLGHPEGDRLLTDVASILRACFRASDVVGRLGGDEFVVLAPDAGDHADALRTRIRAAVASFNAESDRAYRISVSIGLCSCDSAEPAALEDLVRQADRRMYEDKLARGTGRGEAPVERRPPSGV
ncbi:MAG: diguanylate cyclase [Myxococcales bacterium]|nr:diguanylate cyclase [Myxococcales bacterium]